MSGLLSPSFFVLNSKDGSLNLKPVFSSLSCFGDCGDCGDSGDFGDFGSLLLLKKLNPNLLGELSTKLQ